MAGGKSDALELSLLDRVLGAVAYTPPANWHVALFTAAPSDSGGGTEVAAGGYARVSTANDKITWSDAAAGSVQNDVEIAFAAATAGWGEVVAWALMTAGAGGTMGYWGWLRDSAPVTAPGTATAADDVLLSFAHGLSDADRVVLKAPSGGTLPTGVAEGTVYHVRDVTANTFKLAATAGGAAINLTADGEFVAYRVRPKTIDVDDTLRFPVGALVVTED